MKLSQLIEMQPGWDFKYKKYPAVVKWTEFEREEVDRNKETGEPIFKNNFNMCFTWHPDGEAQIITLHSDHPKPERLDLSEFSC